MGDGLICTIVLSNPNITPIRLSLIPYSIISWHKNRVLISEVFHFEELGFELITPGFYGVCFRDMGIGEFNADDLRFRAAPREV